MSWWRYEGAGLSARGVLVGLRTGSAVAVGWVAAQYVCRWLGVA